MTVEVETLKNHHFRGQARKPGERYSVTTANDLRIVEAMGWSKRAEAKAAAPAAPKRGTYNRRDLTAESPAPAPRQAPAPESAPAEPAAPAVEPEQPAEKPAEVHAPETPTPAAKKTTPRARKADE
jgi:hypothetical protein